jgi:hypothetical protein
MLAQIEQKLFVSIVFSECVLRSHCGSVSLKELVRGSTLHGRRSCPIHVLHESLERHTSQRTRALLMIIW